MENFIRYLIIITAAMTAIFWAVDSYSAEATSLEDAINRPTKVEKIVTENAECVIVTKHNHTYVQCVPIIKR